MLSRPQKTFLWPFNTKHTFFEEKPHILRTKRGNRVCIRPRSN